MTLVLICEGACNPSRESIDSEVRAFRTSGFGAVEHGFAPRLPDYLIEDVRSLHHTPHLVLRDEWAACERCQSVRRHHKTTTF